MLVRPNPIIFTIIFLLFLAYSIHAIDIEHFNKLNKVKIGNAYIAESRVVNGTPIEFPAKYVNTEFGEVDVCLPATDFYVFDGTSYVEFQDKNFFNIENKDFSIEFWMKANSTSRDEQFLFYKGDNNHYFSVYMPSEGRIGFIFSDSVVSSGTIETENLYKDDQWHHVLILRLNNVIKVYIDGVQQLLNGYNEYEVQVQSISVSSEENVALGANNAFTNALNTFNGIIAKPRVWSSALSDDEVEQRYLQPPPAVLKQLNRDVQPQNSEIIEKGNNPENENKINNVSKFPSPFTSYIISSPTTIAYIPQFILGMIPEEKSSKK